MIECIAWAEESGQHEQAVRFRAQLDVVEDDRPVEPEIEPENWPIMRAYVLVSDSVHGGFSGPGPPIWADIRAVLDLNNMWDPEIQTGLAGLFRRVRSIQSREADERREEEKSMRESAMRSRRG